MSITFGTQGRRRWRPRTCTCSVHREGLASRSAECAAVLKNVRLPAGTKYAVLTTEAQPKPDKKTGRVPSDEELAKWQRVRPIMNEILQSKGLVNLAEDKVFVTGLRGWFGGWLA